MALLQRAELDRLYQRLAQLTEKLARARGEDAIAALQLELTAIREQLEARTRALFGPSSERRAAGTREDAPSAPVPHRGHGPREQAALPLVEVVHTRADETAPCSQSGGALEPWKDQYEEAEEIDVRPR